MTQVTVKRQGKVEAVFTFETADAEVAIEMAETEIGAKPARVSIDKATGNMFVMGWSGHEFVARAV